MKLEENGADNVDRASKLDTACISDALDHFEINGQCRHIAPRSPDFRLIGRAYTVRFGPAANPPGTVGDFIDDVPEGSVLVLDNGGSEVGTVWGDILTEIAHHRRIAGTVIDGLCRDVSLCIELGYPVFSKSHWMRTGKDRVQVEAINDVACLGGVRVAPGDLIKGDADGIVVIPREHEEKVLDHAEMIHNVEEKIRAAVRSGTRLDAARRSFNYHRLQSKQ